MEAIHIYIGIIACCLPGLHYPNASAGILPTIDIKQFIIGTYHDKLCNVYTHM